MYDRADSMRFAETPYKEYYRRSRGDYHFQYKEVATFQNTSIKLISNLEYSLTNILCTGNHIRGNDRSQNRKKHTKSRVFVPEEVGSELAGFQSCS